MARGVIRRGWPRKRSSDLPFLRFLDMAGLGLAIACVLLTLGFVALEVGDSLMRK